MGAKSTMGGDSSNMVVTLYDQHGKIVNACTNFHSSGYDALDVCAPDSPFKHPCVFTGIQPIRDKIKVPIFALLVAAGVDLDQSILDPETRKERYPDAAVLDACLVSYMSGVSPGNWDGIKAAGYNSADTYSTFEEFQEGAKDACARLPMRLFGVELQISFDFDNMNGARDSFDLQSSPDSIRVACTVKVGPTHGALATDITGTTGYSGETTRTTQGLFITMDASGELCTPDFAVFLITMTTILGLLGAANSMTEFIMLGVLPQRGYYKEAKVELTEDFSDLRDSLRESKAGATMGKGVLDAVQAVRGESFDEDTKKRQVRRDASGGAGVEERDVASGNGSNPMAQSPPESHSKLFHVRRGNAEVGSQSVQAICSAANQSAAI
jgi:hypothetical protein